MRSSPDYRPSQGSRCGEGQAAHLRRRARATHSSWRWPTLQFSPPSVTREPRPSMPETASCSRHTPFQSMKPFMPSTSKPKLSLP